MTKWKSRFRRNSSMQLGDVIDYLAYQRDIEAIKLQQMEIARDIARMRANAQKPAISNSIFASMPPRTAAEAREDEEYNEWAQANPYQGLRGKARWQEARRKAAEAKAKPAWTWRGFLGSLLLRGPDIFTWKKPECVKLTQERPKLRIVAKHLH